MNDFGLAILLVVLVMVSIATLRELVDRSHGSAVYRSRPRRRASSMRRAA